MGGGSDQVNPQIVTTPPSYIHDMGGAVSDAIYAYGRGSIVRAKEKLVESFLKSKTGQVLEAEAIKQKSNEYAPLIFGALVLIFIGGFLVRRKT